MPKGIKGFQKGHKQLNSGKTHFQKKNVPWNKGKKCPQLAGVNNGFYNKKHTDETKMTIKFKKTGKRFRRTEKNKENSSKARIELLKKGFENPIKKGQRYEEVFGKKKAMEIKKSQSQSAIGRECSEETIEKIKKNRAKQIFPIKDSSIEVKIQNFLKVLGIEFFTHQYMKIEHGYQCDILIPSMNLVIECDGDYWHKYPIGLEKDHIRTQELIEKGFKVLRLWEFEIKEMNIDGFVSTLNGEIK